MSDVLLTHGRALVTVMLSKDSYERSKDAELFARAQKAIAELFGDGAVLDKIEVAASPLDTIPERYDYRVRDTLQAEVGSVVIDLGSLSMGTVSIDGKEIPYVTSLEIKAEPGDVPRVTLTALACETKKE